MNPQRIRIVFFIGVLLLGFAPLTTYNYAMQDRWFRAVLIGVAVPIAAAWEAWKLHKMGPETGKSGASFIFLLALALGSTWPHDGW